ncbi:MAG: hypothetical protein FWE45_04000 [Firmicutes bacterium]|nr:hypothetical protein [Bacillota bacterium]
MSKLDMTIEELEFTTRTENVLVRAGKRTLGDLVIMSEKDLMRVRNLGARSFNEIVNRARWLGYDIGMTKEDIEKIENPPEVERVSFQDCHEGAEQIATIGVTSQDMYGGDLQKLSKLVLLAGDYQKAYNTMTDEQSEKSENRASKIQEMKEAELI